jgi:uncharacterized protein YcbK (DUF882 family)
MGGHVTVKAARRLPLQLRLTRASYCGSIAAFLIFFGSQSLQNATAEGETRTISLHHIHTNEDLTITYKVNGRYDEAALNKINHLLRDWRQEQPIRMDPHVIDLLWEVHRELGAKEPIWIVCGYRSPTTNSALRKRSSGVAKFSQHMQGKAIDFHIPGVPLEELRAAGLRAQRGGVGYYPSSGFVHLDTGGVRHWPRMPEPQLAKIVARGDLTSRFASDAKGTAIARGDIQRPSTKPNFLAKLFGAKDDEEETAESAQATATTASKSEANKSEAKPQKLAAAAVHEANNPKSTGVPLPPSRPQLLQLASADTKLLVRTAPEAELVSASFAAAPAEISATPPVRFAQVTTTPANGQTASDVINARGFWHGVPSAEPVEASHPSSERLPNAAPAPRRTAEPKTESKTESKTTDAKTKASATPWPIADRGAGEPMPNALSYAAQPTPIATSRAMPMGNVGRRPQADTTVVAKRSEERVPETTSKTEGAVNEPNGKAARIGGVVRVGDRFDDPWMRVMIVSPSAQSYMKATLFGAPDFRNLGPYLHKPAAALPLSFTAQDPYPGMSSEKFAGSAVTFISSVPMTSRSAAR